MSKTPFKKIRCPKCNAPIRVVDRIWNADKQNFDYKLARHQHRWEATEVATADSTPAMALTPEQEPKRGLMSFFRVKIW